jgi:hypothetical protein
MTNILQDAWAWPLVRYMRRYAFGETEIKLDPSQLADIQGRILSGASELLSVPGAPVDCTKAITFHWKAFYDHMGTGRALFKEQIGRKYLLHFIEYLAAAVRLPDHILKGGAPTMEEMDNVELTPWMCLKAAEGVLARSDGLKPGNEAGWEFAYQVLTAVYKTAEDQLKQERPYYVKGLFVGGVARVLLLMAGLALVIKVLRRVWPSSLIRSSRALVTNAAARVCRVMRRGTSWIRACPGEAGKGTTAKGASTLGKCPKARTPTADGKCRGRGPQVVRPNKHGVPCCYSTKPVKPAKPTKPSKPAKSAKSVRRPRAGASKRGA